MNSWNCKILLLGGGGHNASNIARAWAHVTSAARGQRIPEDIPIPDHFSLEHYAPSFTLDIPGRKMRDANTEDYLNAVKSTYSSITAAIRESVST